MTDGPMEKRPLGGQCRCTKRVTHESEDGTVTDTRRGIPEHDFASHEHAEMRRGIEGITEAARLQVSNDELTMAALEILHWVDHVLEPHAQWEDLWLYPEIDERAGTRWATKLMTYEHRQIRDAAQAVAGARLGLRGAWIDRRRHRAARSAVRTGCGRYGAIWRGEERFLIPLLDEPPAAADSASMDPRTSPAGAA